MQFPRSTVQSLPETFEFDHVSTPSNSDLNQQFFRNGMLNPVDNRNMQQFLPSAIENTDAHANTVSHDADVFNGTCLGEPSSSVHALHHVSHREPMANQGHMNSISDNTRAIMRSEVRDFEPTSTLPLESFSIDLNCNQISNVPFIQNAHSNNTIQNANLGARFLGNIEHTTEVTVSNHPHIEIGLEHGQIPSHGGSSSLCAPALGMEEHPNHDIDGKPGCSLDRMHISCKRKAVEEVSDIPLCGSSSCCHQAESSTWHGGPIQHNASGILNISNDAEHLSSVNPQEEIISVQQDVGGNVASQCHLAVSGNASTEGSRRNSRPRFNSANQIFAYSNPWHLGNNIRRPHVLPPCLPPSRNISDHYVDPRLLAANTASTQSQIHVPHFPGYLHNMHPYVGIGSSSRTGCTLYPPLSLRERSTGGAETANFNGLPRSTTEHAMFLPVSTQVLTDWDLTNGNPNLRSLNVPGHTSSQTFSSSGAQASLVSALAPQQHRPRHPRRLFEALPPPQPRFSTSRRDAEASTSNNPPTQLDAGSSQETLLPTAVGRQGHQSYRRQAFLMERLGDGALGVQLPLRSWSSASEGRSRLASELRSVLEIIRRGENMRFEDALILDHSILFGGPDWHDHHRDMRLDIDNMSYEELLALEERIGSVNTGLVEETILKCLKRKHFSSIAIAAGPEVEPCCICREDYVEGEELGILDCGHDFHTECIKRWLMVKNLCPICRMTALLT